MLLWLLAVGAVAAAAAGVGVANGHQALAVGGGGGSGGGSVGGGAGGRQWRPRLTVWQSAKENSPYGTQRVRKKFTFEVYIEEPADVWIDLTGWGTGIVFANGFTLGKYWNTSPERAVYWPADFQRKGLNEILIVELFQEPADIKVILVSNNPTLDNRHSMK